MKNFIQRLRMLLLALSLAALFTLPACAAGPELVAHGFSFDGRNDKWVSQIDLLEYNYGDQYRMTREQVRPDKQSLPYQSSVNGSMPVGEFLYVKWRIKETGEVLEDRVDLRKRLAPNMFEHKVTFVIDGKQLYVYLITPKAKRVEDPPPLKTFLSRYTVTYEIYPNNTYKP